MGEAGSAKVRFRARRPGAISETEVRWLLGRCRYDMLRKELVRRPAEGAAALPLREPVMLHVALPG